ncbi:MAG: acyl-CoA dehydrogenase [Mucilaginibacter sp.]
MKEIAHPSVFIKPGWKDTIRRTATQAEQLGLLPPEQLELIYRQKWFKALVPAEYGGLELSLPALVSLQEALSWADGSFGWVFTLCCGAGWFAGFIDKGIAPEIFAGEDICLAGSGASTGEAVETRDGYIINGQWNYASGAHHATHFTANCVIKNGSETVLDEDGNPLILPFIVDRKDVKLLETWKYIGMVATGSHSFKIENLHVGRERSFKIDPDFTTIDKPLYKYPFLQLAEATLAANLMGMAIHFVDLTEVIIGQRMELNKYSDQQKLFLQDKLNTIKAAIAQSRKDFYNAVDASWVVRREAMLAEVSRASRLLAKTAKESVDELYPYCGLKAAAPDTEINRVWRDLHTASQHTLLTFPVFESEL